VSRGYRDEDDDQEDEEGVSLGIVEVIHETDRAILCRGKGLAKPDPFGTEGADVDEQWIPKSQFGYGNAVHTVGDKGELVISQWLADQREKNR